MNPFKSPILYALLGAFLTIMGFVFSDKIVYPVWSKFSGAMIVVGVLLFGLSVPTKWNPIAKISA